MIDRFTGEYAFLSNFYAAPLRYAGHTYPTSEHAFQAMKTKDPEEQAKIRQAATPYKAKQLGKKVKLRPDWESVKVGIMREILFAKFTQNPALLQQLEATGTEELVEGNDWGDVTWGQVDGKGQNWLGKLLMEVRGRGVTGAC